MGDPAVHELIVGMVAVATYEPVVIMVAVGGHEPDAAADEDGVADDGDIAIARASDREVADADVLGQNHTPLPI